MKNLKLKPNWWRHSGGMVAAWWRYGGAMVASWWLHGGFGICTYALLEMSHDIVIFTALFNLLMEPAENG